MKTAYIVKAYRTAVGKAPRGLFRFKRPDELAAETIAHMMKELPQLDKKRIDDVKEFVNKLPKDLVEIKGNKLVLKDIKKLPVLESYIDKENVDYITITKDPTMVTFSFETDGSFSAKVAILESAKILEKKYAEFGKLLKKLK